MRNTGMAALMGLLLLAAKPEAVPRTFPAAHWAFRTPEFVGMEPVKLDALA